MFNSFEVFVFEILLVLCRGAVILIRRSLKFDYLCTHFSDNNECTLGTHNCHNNATCTNTDGSFTCACNTGYSGNGVKCTGRLKIAVVKFCLVVALVRYVSMFDIL